MCIHPLFSSLLYQANDVVVVGYPLLPADWGESNAPPLFGPFHIKIIYTVKDDNLPEIYITKCISLFFYVIKLVLPCERTCKLCNENVSEGEYHFLYACLFFCILIFVNFFREHI